MSACTRVRIRTKGGATHQVSVPHGSTLQTLVDHVCTATKIAPSRLQLLLGYPPTQVEGSLEDTIEYYKITDGSLLIAEDSSAPTRLAHTPAAQVASTSPAPSPVPAVTQTEVPVSATLTKNAPTAAASATGTSTTSEPSLHGISGVGSKRGSAVTQHNSEGVVLRRVVNADNSCLFNSIGYVLEGCVRTKANLLRRVVANAIRSHPEQYSEAVLGKSPAQYVTWISNNDSWGGAIELSVLAKAYQTEIAAFDIETTRVIVFGEEAGYKQRALVIYDGIHYDPLALTFDKQLPEECDVTLFHPQDEYVFARALELSAALHKQKNFTNMSTFTLRCLVCQKGLTGQAEAVEHAKSLGHTNFAEYR